MKHFQPHFRQFNQLNIGSMFLNKNKIWKNDYKIIYQICYKKQMYKSQIGQLRQQAEHEASFSSFNEGPKQLFQSGYGERFWLKNRGKQDFIPFSDNALIELRKYFDSLDQKKCGSVGVQELEDPFIAFGLSQSRDEVQELIDSVDQDGSGKIQFDQFLSIMLKIKRGKSKGNDTKNSAMFDFFQKMSSGQLGKQFDKNLTFKMNVSQFRRRQLLESMMSENKQKKQKGTKILQSFKKQISANPNLKQILNDSKKGNIFMYGFDVKKGRSKLR